MSSSSRSASPEPVELPAQLAELANYIEVKPESLVDGDADIRLAALNATKFLFDRAVAMESEAATSIDDLLKSVELPQAPVTRSASAKRNASPPPPKEPLTFSLTPVSSLVLSGMGPHQIWEQLELRTKNICSVLDSIVEREAADSDDENTAEGPSRHDVLNGMDVDDNDEDEAMGFGDEDEDDIDHDEEDEEDEPGEEEDLGEDVVALRDEDEQLPLWTGPKHPTLDDGFFSIDRFNRQTELMEAKSTSSGRLKNDDSDSDEEEEEEVDLFAPLDDEEEDDDAAIGIDEDAGSEEEDSELDDAEEEEASGSGSGMGVEFTTEGTDGIMYNDFFRPPYRFNGAPPSPQQPGTKKTKAKPSVRFAESVRVKNIKARGKGKSLNLDADDSDDSDEEDFSTAVDPRIGTGPNGFGGFAPRKPVIQSSTSEEGMDEDEPPLDFDDMDDIDDSASGSEDIEEEDDDDDDEMEEDEEEEVYDEGVETIERLKDDLFPEPEPDYKPPEEYSTHERRMAAIAREIAILEDENVSEKPWELMGEANAKDRAENSLLETDLDFEHAAKPAPIITEEVTKTLDDMIKSRILQGVFDDVVRQRPMDDKAFLPSSILELQDTQSKKSLAQIYEDDYTASAAGEAGKDPRGGKLATEHEEIEKTWSDICYKLDALCNTHFTPKQPKATISTITNVASTTLENALPTSVSTSTLLAPQEVFAYDATATKSLTEMTPTEKRALRTKHKHSRKKQGQTLRGAVVTFAGGSTKTATGAAGFGKRPKNAKEAKEVALQSLVKTGKGVTVVGKPHMGKTGAKGRSTGANSTSNGAAQFKL